MLFTMLVKCIDIRKKLPCLIQWPPRLVGVNTAGIKSVMVYFLSKCKNKNEIRQR